MTLSDSRFEPSPIATLETRSPPAAGLPRLPETPFRHAVPTTPADRDGCSCRLLPYPVRPSPNLRRVGIRNFTFEACSGFTYVTACRIAQPPSAAFVARLQPARSPRQAACQLPDQTDYYLGGTFLHWCSAPSGRTETSGLGVGPSWDWIKVKLGRSIEIRHRHDLNRPYRSGEL
jgi:hypothetical protein